VRQTFDINEKKRIGGEVRAFLARNGIQNARAGSNKLISSPKSLAHAAGVSEATIYKLHSGEFSVKTLRLVEDILGANFHNGEENNPSHEHSFGTHQAIVDSGGYTRSQIEPYLGNYLSIRRSVSFPDNFLGTYITVFWDEENQIAKFTEDNNFTASDGRKLDFSQSGTLHMSSQIGTIHFLTSTNGALRMMTLTRLQVPDLVMYGAILSQIPEGGHYMPLKTTVFLKKITESYTENVLDFLGPIKKEHPSYNSICRDLDVADKAIVTR